MEKETDEFKEHFIKERGYLNYIEDEPNLVWSLMRFEGLSKIREKRDYEALLKFAKKEYDELLTKSSAESSRTGYLRLFKYIELYYNFSLTNPLFPNYILLPPYLFVVKKKYLAKYYNFPGDRQDLFESGILPFDNNIHDELMGIPTKINKEAVSVIDIDYFLRVFGSEKYPNFFMGQEILQHYEKEFPGLSVKKDLILNIGTIRAHRVFKNKNDYSVETMLPISYKVTSREQLDEIINNVQNTIKGSTLSLWMRGQPNEYIVKSPGDKAVNSIFKWRAIKDISLWPSLYRSVQKDIVDLPAYARKCVDLSYYSFVMSQYLDLDKNIILENQKEDNQSPGIKIYENPLTYQSILKKEDGTQEVILKQYRPIEQSLTKSLFLQHYGIPTNILDITDDLDVALFFAKMKIINNSYNVNKNPGYIYLFLLEKNTDMFVNSAHLLKNTGLLRPIRQKCGLLYGASMINRNHYARYISIRLELDGNFEIKYDQHYLFPSRSEDPFLDILSKAHEQNPSLSFHPFELKV